MELKEILSKCDHTLLAQTATWAEIRAICDDGVKYGCASVCIPAGCVRQAADYVDAVSYTHLDVYKRQVRYHGLQKGPRRTV